MEVALRVTGETTTGIDIIAKVFQASGSSLQGLDRMKRFENAKTELEAMLVSALNKAILRWF
jgi:hypothetical protein